MLAAVFSCSNDLHARREKLVAAGVIAMSVRVDDLRDGFVGDCLHLVEYRLAIVGELGIHEHHSIGREEDCGVSARAGYHVKVVGHLLDCPNGAQSSSPASLFPWSSLAGLLGAQPCGDRNQSHTNDHSECKQTFHDAPPLGVRSITVFSAPASRLGSGLNERGPQQV